MSERTARATAALRRNRDTLLELAGLVLLVAGIALIFVPAALIVAGLALVAVGNLPLSGRR